MNEGERKLRRLRGGEERKRRGTPGTRETVIVDRPKARLTATVSCYARLKADDWMLRAPRERAEAGRRNV